MKYDLGSYCGSSAKKVCCRNKFWLAFICAVLLSVAAYANPAENKSSAVPVSHAAKTSNNANNVSDSNSQKSAKAGIANIPGKIIKDSKKGLDDASETSGYILELAKSSADKWPQRIIKGTKESFLRPDNLSIILLAGGASVALHSSDADDKIADNFEDHHSFHGFTDESLNIVGNPWTHFGASVLWYGVSKKNHDDFNTERAKSMVAALSVTNVATFSLKAIRHNDSPNGKDWVWSSGNTASSFTVASMLDEYYGPSVGIPAYALASLIAYRMVDTGDQWTSDVVIGAAVGWVVGHTFGAKQKQLEIAGFKVLPYTACAPGNNGTVAGVNLAKRF
jgi:hypothetical protein